MIYGKKNVGHRAIECTRCQAICLLIFLNHRVLDVWRAVPDIAIWTSCMPRKDGHDSSESPGQIDSQVAASWTCVGSCVEWLNGWTPKCPHRYTKFEKTPPISRLHVLYFIALRTTARHLTLLTCVGWPNGENLASTCGQLNLIST